MTLGEVDEVLRVWKARLASIAENLMELQSDAVYQSLSGTGGMTPIAVTGVTAARLKPALGAMNTMFEQFGLLQATVDKAERLRAELPAFFGGEAKARELEHLLFGKSIQLAAIEIPLEQRTLLGGIHSAQKVSPEELLAPMERSFTAARDAVAVVDRGWVAFGAKSAQIEGEIARLRTQRALPSAVLAASLAEVETRFASIRAAVQTDPLGAERQLQAEVDSALAQVGARVDLALGLTSQLRAACVRCEDLVRTHAEATSVVAEADDKVAGANSLPGVISEDKVRGLQEWLTRLEHKREEGVLEAVGIGLRNWNAATEACLAQDRQALAVARARMEQRSELRGRMDALKAKARHYGVAESQMLTELSVKVDVLLYSRPIDLAAAAAAVARFEKHLSRGREGI